MAKISLQRGLNAKTIPVVEDVVEYEDGGIYWHEKKIGEKWYFISPVEQAKILSKLDDHAGQLAAELARIEADDLPRAANGDDHDQADASNAAYLIRELRAIVAQERSHIVFANVCEASRLLIPGFAVAWLIACGSRS